MKKSRKQQEIEARKAADPIAQALGRTDIDYSTDALPTAPRGEFLANRHCKCGKVIGLGDGECTGWHPEFKCECGFEASGGNAPEYRFCPMCGKVRPIEIFNDGVIQGQ
jgi:hypothetical protein